MPDIVRVSAALAKLQLYMRVTVLGHRGEHCIIGKNPSVCSYIGLKDSCDCEGSIFLLFVIHGVFALVMTVITLLSLHPNHQRLSILVAYIWRIVPC